MTSKQVVSSTLRLEFQVGVDENSQPIIKRKNFMNIDAAAADEALFESGKALASLQNDPLLDIVRLDTGVLMDE